MEDNSRWFQELVCKENLGSISIRRERRFNQRSLCEGNRGPLFVILQIMAMWRELKTMSALRESGCKASTTKCDFGLRERRFETTKNDVNCIFAQFLKNHGKANFYEPHGRHMPCRACRTSSCGSRHGVMSGMSGMSDANGLTRAIHVGASQHVAQVKRLRGWKGD